MTPETQPCSPSPPSSALAALLGACGGGDSAHNAAGGRTIDIDMRDNDFSQASVNVKAGEQIQFVFHNKGARSLTTRTSATRPPRPRTSKR